MIISETTWKRQQQSWMMLMLTKEAFEILDSDKTFDTERNDTFN
jgi:hypothetical protein